MEKLCEREKLRHELPINAAEQLSVLQRFAADVAEGSCPDDDTLDYAIASVNEKLDAESRYSCIGKMAPNHPLIQRRSDRLWEFTQEQIMVAILAKYLEDIVGDNDALYSFSENAVIQDDLLGDIASMEVETAFIEMVQEEPIERLKRMISAFAGKDRRSVAGHDRDNTLMRLSTNIALKAVDRILPKGSIRSDRTETLQDMFGGGFSGLTICSPVTSMDFRGVRFDNCKFDHVRWINCEFDSSTLFKGCHFVGGSRSKANTFGEAKWERLSADDEARAFISYAQIESGKKDYTESDLRSDIDSFIGRFLIKGGGGVRAVAAPDLITGTIGHSKHRDLIVHEFKKAVIEAHPISGTRDGGYNIREYAKESVLFYAANNVFTGPLHEIFEELKKKIKI